MTVKRSGDTSAAQKQWQHFMVQYNRQAKKCGRPQIRTLASLLRADSESEYLNDTDALLLQVRFYEHLIDRIDPLAERGFNMGRNNRRNAAKPRRHQLHDLLVLLATSHQYDDWNGRELWQEFIALGSDHGLHVIEVSDSEIEWDEIDSEGEPKCGSLKYASFAATLSRKRRDAGCLKRSKKSN